MKIQFAARRYQQKEIYFRNGRIPLDYMAHVESCGTKGMQLAELFRPDDRRKLRLASQVGVRHAIMITRPVLQQVPRTRYVEVLSNIKDDLAKNGMIFAGVESHPVPAEKIKLGIPGRDAEIENYIAVIKALAQVGVPLVCYNWMAGLGWYRTRVDLPIRGNALTSEFDYGTAQAQGPTEWGDVSEECLWGNLEYFLKIVVPVAEKAGVKLAVHPDDPPISPLRGISRILTSAAAFRRLLSAVPSPSNGIAFCQANFKLMGEDIVALAREWAQQKKLFFVHLRDVEGSREHFHETFHDQSRADMVKMIRTYHECGFDGPIRPDHAPTLEGEENDSPGYSMNGKLFAFGYIKGIMDGLEIPYV